MERRDGTQKAYVFPTECPHCHGPLVRDEKEAAHYCINTDCEARIVESLAHFASRDAMNIDGLGVKTVETLVQAKLIKTIADIYTLKEKKDELLGLQGFKEKSVDGLIQAIEASKGNSMERLITGLGIRQVGEKAARSLALSFANIDALSQSSEEDLSSIRDIGKITASFITGYFKEEHNQHLLQRLKDAGVQMESRLPQIERSAFSDLTVVVTGSIPNHTREQVEEWFRIKGAKVSSSVSKKTDLVVYGEAAGSKLKKAQELGVRTMNAEEWLKELET